MVGDDGKDDIPGEADLTHRNVIGELVKKFGVEVVLHNVAEKVKGAVDGGGVGIVVYGQGQPPLSL